MKFTTAAVKLFVNINKHALVLEDDPVTTRLRPPVMGFALWQHSIWDHLVKLARGTLIFREPLTRGTGSDRGRWEFPSSWCRSGHRQTVELMPGRIGAATVCPCRESRPVRGGLSAATDDRPCVALADSLQVSCCPALLFACHIAPPSLLTRSPKQMQILRQNKRLPAHACLLLAYSGSRKQERFAATRARHGPRRWICLRSGAGPPIFCPANQTRAHAGSGKLALEWLWVCWGKPAALLLPISNWRHDLPGDITF